MEEDFLDNDFSKGLSLSLRSFDYLFRIKKWINISFWMSMFLLGANLIFIFLVLIGSFIEQGRIEPETIGGVIALSFITGIFGIPIFFLVPYRNRLNRFLVRKTEVDLDEMMKHLARYLIVLSLYFFITFLFIVLAIFSSLNDILIALA